MSEGSSPDSGLSCAGSMTHLCPLEERWPRGRTKPAGTLLGVFQAALTTLFQDRRLYEVNLPNLIHCPRPKSMGLCPNQKSSHIFTGKKSHSTTFHRRVLPIPILDPVTIPLLLSFRSLFLIGNLDWDFTRGQSHTLNSLNKLQVNHVLINRQFGNLTSVHST